MWGVCVNYTPLWPLVKSVVEEKQPDGYEPTAASDDGLLYHSPLREDHNPSFVIWPDGAEDNPGGFYDRARGDKGSMAELADLLGIDPHVSHNNTGPGIDDFCVQRKLDKAKLQTFFDVREARCHERPALVYPTPIG